MKLSATSRALAVSATLLLFFSSVSYAEERGSLRERLFGSFGGLRNLQVDPTGAPPTAAPPTSSPPGGCDTLLGEFADCVTESEDACVCDANSPGDDCEAFGEWYEFNFFCCVSDGCGAQLEALKECKACPATPPPTASGIPPNQPTETIADIVESDPRLGTLENLLIAQGLLDTLREPGSSTLFAPTNEAFTALNIQPGMPTEASILLYHVVSELVEPLTNGNEYATLNGADVTITVVATGPKVNDANIDDSMEASNGLVYVIDAVLMPPPGDGSTPPQAPPTKAPPTPEPPTKAPPTPIPPTPEPPTNAPPTPIPPTKAPPTPVPPTKSPPTQCTANRDPSNTSARSVAYASAANERCAHPRNEDNCWNLTRRAGFEHSVQSCERCRTSSSSRWYRAVDFVRTNQ